LDRTFVLGVGAQKAGTTWLSDYLRADKKYRFGAIKEKEFHVWDRKDLPMFAPPKRRVSTLRSKGQFLLRAMGNSTSVYFRYFGSLLRNGGIAADITPSYAGLSAARYAQINQGFRRQGIQVKTVFMMRDPVSRCVSGFNMSMHKASKNLMAGDVAADRNADAAFLDYIETEGSRMRSDYLSTLAALREGFAPSQIKVLIYENLFEPETIRDFSEFFGVGFFPDRADIKSNVAKKKIQVSDEALSKCALMLRDTYEGIGQEFPQVRSLWRGYQYFR